MQVHDRRVVSERDVWNHQAQPPLQCRNPLASSIDHLPSISEFPVMGGLVAHFISAHFRSPGLIIRNSLHILGSLNYQLISYFLITSFIQMIFFLEQHRLCSSSSLFTKLILKSTYSYNELYSSRIQAYRILKLEEII